MVRFRNSAILIAVALLASCGAGVISGVVLGRDDSSGSQIAPDLQTAVTMSTDRGPLALDPNERYEVSAVLTNIDVPVDANVVVDLMLPASTGHDPVAQRQPDLVIENLSEGRIRWRLATDAFAEMFPDPTAQDVDVRVCVGSERDGDYRLLGEGSFRLLRKPVAQLAVNGTNVIPILGGTIPLTVTPRLSDELQVEVRATSSQTRFARIEHREDEGDETRLAIAVPVGVTPEEFSVLVVDREAGRSTSVSDLFYAPDLAAVVGRTGSTEGDQALSLIGTGLIPLVPDGNGGSVEDLSRVEVAFIKGGFERVVEQDDFLPALSQPGALTVRSPQSPDGIPGVATIEVRVSVAASSGGRRVVVDRESGLFAYAAQKQSFEPRGLAISNSPLDIEFGYLTGLKAPDRPIDASFLIASDLDNIGLVGVLSATGSGMFDRIGKFAPAGEPGFGSVLSPVDFCIGDFVDDPFADVMVLNLGFSQRLTSILPNADNRRGLLGSYSPGFPVEDIPQEIASGRFEDRDRDDILVATVQSAAMFLRSDSFVPRCVLDDPLWSPAFEGGRFEVARPLDVDRDGLDEAVFVVRSFQRPRSLISFIHKGPTELVASGPFDMTGYVFDHQTTHVLSTGNARRPGLVLVLDPPATVPPGPKRLVSLASRPDWSVRKMQTLDVPPTADGRRFGISAATSLDLDRDGEAEIVLGSESTGIRTYRVDPFSGEFTLGDELEEFDGETIGKVLEFGVGPVGGGQTALFVTHEVVVGESRETRVTTLLIRSDGSFAGPKVRRDLERSALNIVTTGLRGDGVAVAYKDGIERFESDAFGELTSTEIVDIPEIVPETLTPVRVGDDVVLMFLVQSGIVGVLAPGSALPVYSEEQVFPRDARELVTVQPGTRLATGDFDGDSVEDVAILLQFEGARRGVPERTVLVGLRQRAGPFPFELVGRDSAVEWSRADSLSLGNFARDSGTKLEEIAVAILTDDGREGIGFFRFDGVSGFESATASGGLVGLGRRPTLARALDIDSDGVDDLAVLSSPRSEVTIYLQQDPRFGSVNVDGFQIVDARVVIDGSRPRLELADIDGDSIDDFLVAVTSDQDEPLIGALLWDGVDRVSRGFAIPASRLGTALEGAETRQFSFTLGDTNKDGKTDLISAWSAGPESTEASHIQTLFGSRR